MEIERYEIAWEEAKKGNFEGIPADIKLRHYNTLKNIAKDHMVRPVDVEGVCGLWIYGQSGVGKSRKVREEHSDFYYKLCNKWWDGYQDQDVVLIEDIGLEHKCLGHHLKLWSDRYAFLAEIKGGAMYIRPKKIIVTSQYLIEEIFVGDKQTIDALNRRFQFEHIVSPLVVAEPDNAI